MEKKVFKLNNKILIPSVIGLVLILAVAGYFIFSQAKKGDMIYIHKNGEVIEKIDLGKVDEPYTVDLGTNKLYVEKDGVTMKEATCPDKICIQMGKITKDTEAIVCAPNKIMIEFKGAKKDTDAVAGAR